MKGHIGKSFEQLHTKFIQKNEKTPYWKYLATKEVDKGIFQHHYIVEGPKDFKCIHGQNVFVYTKENDGEVYFANLEGNKKALSYESLEFTQEPASPVDIMKQFLKRPEIIAELNEKHCFHKREEIQAVLNSHEKIKDVVEPLESVVSIDICDSNTIQDGSTHHKFVIRGNNKEDLLVRVSQNIDKKENQIFIDMSISGYFPEKKLSQSELEKRHGWGRLDWKPHAFKKYKKGDIGRDTIKNFINKVFHESDLKYWSKSENYVAPDETEESRYFNSYKNRLDQLVERVSERNISTDFDLPKLKEMTPDDGFEFEQELSQYTRQLYQDIQFRKIAINNVIDLFNELKDYDFKEARFQKVQLIEVQGLSHVVEALMKDLKKFQEMYQELLVLQHEISSKLLVIKTEETLKTQQDLNESVIDKLKLLLVS